MANEDTRIVISASDQTKAAFDGVSRNFESIKTSAAGLQTLITGLSAALSGLVIVQQALKFADSTKELVDVGDATNKLAQRTGIAVEQLSAYSFAAKLADVSQEDLNVGLKKLAVNMANAAGGGEMAKAFKAIGVSVKDANGNLRDTDSVLSEVSAKFASYAEGPAKAALAVELFGKAGDKLIPFLNTMRDATQEAKRLNVVFGADFAQAAERFNDNMTRIGAQSDAVKVRLAEGVLPRLTEVADEFIKAAAKGEKFIGILTAIAQIAGFSDPAGIAGQKELIAITEKRLRLQDQLDKLNNAPGGDMGVSPGLQNRINAMKTEIELIDKRASVLKALQNLGDPRDRDARDLRLLQPATAQAPLLDKKAVSETDFLKPIKTFVDGVREQLTGLTDGEFERMRLKAADVFKRLDRSKLTGDELGQLPALFDQVNKDIAAIEDRSVNATWAKALAESFKISGDAAERADAAFASFNEQQSQIAQDLETELFLVGSLAVARDKLVSARRIDLDARRQIAAIPEGAANRDERIADINTLAESAKQRTSALFDSIRAKSRDTFVGGASAANEYFDRVTNGAENARMVFETSFQGMEDALVKFTTTGKLDFTSLVDSILADIVRIQVRQGITGPLAGALGKSLGGDSGPEQLSGPTDASPGMFDGLKKLLGFAAGGRPPLGVPSMVGERGPELFVPDVAGTIVPNSALGGGGVTIVQYNSVDGRTDRASILLMMAQAKDAAKAEIMDSMNRGGAFAR